MSQPDLGKRNVTVRAWTRGWSTLVALGLVACGGARQSPGPEGVQGGASEPHLLARQVDDRPELVAILREGDPLAGLAMALGSAASTADSIAAGAVLAARVRRQVPGFDVHVGLGVVTVSGMFSPADAAKTVAGLDAVLRREITMTELAAADTLSAWQRLDALVRGLDGRLERQVCLGEDAELTGVGKGGDSKLVGRLEQWRNEVLSLENARWGVVGDEQAAKSVLGALRDAPIWPSRKRSLARRVGSDAASSKSGDSNKLTLVVRTARAESAYAIKRVLETMSEPRSLKPSLVRAQALPEGGCLRVEVTGQVANAGAADELVSFARRVVADARRKRADPRDNLILAAFEETHAVRAAELAAQITLSQDGTAPERFAALLETTGPVVEGARGQEVLVTRIGAPLPTTAELATITGVESGQGKLFALLATPCLPRQEPSRYVGSAALFLEAAAATFSGVDGVSLESWVTPEGSGLVASTGRQTPEEPLAAQSARLGRALGRALAGTTDNDVLWRARASLLARLGPGPRPALWLAITGLAPDAPGLLAPLGTFSTIESLKPSDVYERALDWRAQPLRLAFLSNDERLDARPVADEILAWLGSYRFDAKTCLAPLSALREVAGDKQVDATKASGDASATIALQLPTGAPGDDIYAMWLLDVLTGEGGLLRQLEERSGLSARFEATLVGGDERRGLVIAVAAPPAAVEPAIVAVKALLVDLRTGAAPRKLEVAAIGRRQRDWEASLQMERKQRLVELWRGAKPRVDGTEVGFRSFVRRALSGHEPSVVRATPKPESVDGAKVAPVSTSNSGAARTKAKVRSAARP